MRREKWLNEPHFQRRALHLWPKYAKIIRIWCCCCLCCCCCLHWMAKLICTRNFIFCDEYSAGIFHLLTVPLRNPTFWILINTIQFWWEYPLQVHNRMHARFLWIAIVMFVCHTVRLPSLLHLPSPGCIILFFMALHRCCVWRCVYVYSCLYGRPFLFNSSSDN